MIAGGRFTTCFLLMLKSQHIYYVISQFMTIQSHIT